MSSILTISCPENINTEQPVVFYNYNFKLSPYRLGWNTATLAATNFNANYIGVGNFPNFLYANNISGNFEVGDFIYDINNNGTSGLLAQQGDTTGAQGFGTPITELWYYAPYKTIQSSNSPLGIAFTVENRVYLGGNVTRYTVKQTQAVLASHLMWFGLVNTSDASICTPTTTQTSNQLYTSRLAYNQGFIGKVLYSNASLTTPITGKNYFTLYPNSGVGVGSFLFPSEFRNIYNLNSGNGTVISTTGSSCSW